MKEELMKKRKYPWFYPYLVILLLIFFYIGIDILLAVVLIKNNDKTFRAANPYYHHGLIPNQKAIANWYNVPYPVYTNSLGFRDSCIQKIPVRAEKKRILFMGDSHTEGVGVKFKDTFTGQLQNLADSKNIEILNAAAVSYSPRIYYLKTKYLIEEAGLKFDELFVFIDISDIQNEIVYEHFQPKKRGWFGELMFNAKSWAINKSFTLHTINAVSTNREIADFLKKASLFDEYRKNKANVNALNLYASFFDGFSDNVLLSNPKFHGVSEWIYDDEFKKLALRGLSLGRENMVQLYTLCQEHGIKMTISVHPWQEQIKLMNTSDLYVDFWSDFAKKTGVGFINLYPAFIHPPVSAALGMNFFITGDNHWNKNGHWLVAREVYKYLIKI